MGRLHFGVEEVIRRLEELELNLVNMFWIL